MHATVFQNSEYLKLAQEWWFDWHQININRNQLSTLGVAIVGDAGPVLLSHLYPAMTAPIVWVGFTVGDPKVSKFKIGKACNLLLTEIEEATRRFGYRTVFTSFASSTLQKLCKKHGYIGGDPVLEQWKAV